VQLQQLDELLRPQHFFIEADDNCFFLREYTARAGYGHGETNNIISNLKKKLDRKGKPEWRYKEIAIQQAGQELRAAIGDELLRKFTVVPMPPSLSKSNPMYDDRMLRIVGVMTEGLGCDVRELVLQSQDMQPSHETGVRARPENLYGVYYVDEAVAAPTPVNVLVVDDVLTAGAHFAGMKRRLLERFPSVAIFGVFYARRAVQDDPAE
jgi:predicted amidophosphoribosyltransferase